MLVVTERMLIAKKIRDILDFEAKRAGSRYALPEAELLAIRALDPESCSVEELNRTVGPKVLAHLCCEVCDMDALEVIAFQINNDEVPELWVCRDCLLQAVAMLPQKEATGADLHTMRHLPNL